MAGATQTNSVKQIYVPTNGYYTDKCVAAIAEVLKEPSLDLFVAELSLDGMPEFHDKFRVSPNSFKKAIHWSSPSLCSNSKIGRVEEMQRRAPLRTSGS